jgi:hypothetical protein
MFKSPERERKTSAVAEFERLVELKNFDIKQSVLEDKQNLKAPLLGDKDEVGRAQHRLNVKAIKFKINPVVQTERTRREKTRGARILSQASGIILRAENQY